MLKRKNNTFIFFLSHASKVTKNLILFLQLKHDFERATRTSRLGSFGSAEAILVKTKQRETKFYKTQEMQHALSTVKRHFLLGVGTLLLKIIKKS